MFDVKISGQPSSQLLHGVGVAQNNNKKTKIKSQPRKAKIKK